MLFKCRAAHVLWVIYDAEFDGGTHFQIWPEGSSTSGQTRSNKVKFQNLKFSNKICLSCADLSQDSKNVIYFYVRQLKMPKNAFQKMWRHHLYLVFWPLHRQKQWYCFEILYACCLYVSRSYIFRFFENFPMFGKYLKK